ncbi:MAG: hypothetical protein M8352_04695 [ANME-2 cluster archaeon]|nr:hypothetical protein [ANME-2 cluster archaeon]
MNGTRKNVQFIYHINNQISYYGNNQTIINELGSVLIAGTLEIMGKEMQKNISLGIATPVVGNSLEKYFNEVLKDDDECTVLKLQHVVDNRNIDTSFVIS